MIAYLGAGNTTAIWNLIALASIELLEGFWKLWKPVILYLTLQDFGKVSKELDYHYFQIAELPLNFLFHTINSTQQPQDCWVHLKLSHTIQPHKTFLRNVSMMNYYLTTHQSSRWDGLWVVNCVSNKFSFRRNDLCYATILNAPELFCIV
jgi:hypothetical protein